MSRTLFKLGPPICLVFAAGFSALAQVSSKTAAVTPAAAEHAASLAESGHCAEALPLLLKSAHVADKELQKRIGLDGVRCATVLQQQDALFEFLRNLSRQFPHDPEVLYVLTHAFSDLSTHAARELATTAPNSVPALEMDADASEMQGKWDQAEKDYRKILEENPRYRRRPEDWDLKAADGMARGTEHPRALRLP